MPRRAVYNPLRSAQENIRRLWPSQLALATARLCANCRHQHSYQGMESVGCSLLPLTTEGHDCPYYSPLAPIIPMPEAQNGQR